RSAHDLELEEHAPRDPNVVSEMLPGGIGYLRIDAFVSPAADEVEAALHRLERSGVRGLVLDLRDDPGGSAMSCVRVAELFLEARRTIATVTSRGPAHSLGEGLPSRLVTSRSDTFSKPLVALVNGRSASASEMLAMALSENGRAQLVGHRTVGKGTAQTPLPLE